MIGDAKSVSTGALAADREHSISRADSKQRQSLNECIEDGWKSHLEYENAMVDSLLQILWRIAQVYDRSVHRMILGLAARRMDLGYKP